MGPQNFSIISFFDRLICAEHPKTSLQAEEPLTQQKLRNITERDEKVFTELK